MYIVEQKSIFKSSIWKVFEIFSDEPLKIHYIKEISKKINLAPTSVKLHILTLNSEGIIIKKKGERFFGYVANKDSSDFLFYKKVLNLIKIKESKLIDEIVNSIYPKCIILYGSYSNGEDVESSDIDLFILSNEKKEVNADKFEPKLKRKIHILINNNLNKLGLDLKSEIINGDVLYGYLKYD